MKIIVKTLQGKQVELHMEESNTVLETKTQIEALKGELGGDYPVAS